MKLMEFLVDNDWANSFGEARRYVGLGAVKVNDEIATDAAMELPDFSIIQLGKHKIAVYTQLGEIMGYRIVVPEKDMHYFIVDSNNRYFQEVTFDTVQTTSRKSYAYPFYTESAAQEMAWELSAITDQWFGVVWKG